MTATTNHEIKSPNSRGLEQLTRQFIYTAGGMLLALALVNLLSCIGSAQILHLPDPLLGIPLRMAMLITGGMELAVALICLFGQRQGLQMALIAWLVTNFTVYQIGMLWQGCHRQWGCLGNISATLQIPPNMANAAMISSLTFLLLGAFTTLLWPWFAKYGKAMLPCRLASNSYKMSCPGCGIHIRFDGRNLGQTIPCPHCQTVIILRKPDLLIMTCFFCKGHIEFPAHAIGEKIPCPHCKMDITLKEQA
jgi:hypothetical protein